MAGSASAFAVLHKFKVLAMLHLRHPRAR